MKAVYKWRLENGVYGYITNEQNESAFIYDQTTFEREYPDGTVISGTYVDEPLIANIVSKKSKSEYIQMFNEFKEFVNVEYPYVAFLDVMYYYNVENDECSTSAGSLKCAGSDVLFRVKSVISGLEPEVTIEPINSNPENGDLTYDMSFVLPISMVSGGTTSFSALTSNTITVLSSITAEEFVRNNGTEEQYLMADGSITVLNAGTNVTIATATTTDGKTVTISSEDTNTWRNINVNDSQILDNSTNSGLTLSAGTNVTLEVTESGGNKVVKINSSYRNINVNDSQILDNSTNSGLTLSAGTNVTLEVTESGGNKVVKINSTAGVYDSGRNITIDGDRKINAEGYTFDSGITSLVLFDDEWRHNTGLRYISMYSLPRRITTDKTPVGIINISDILLIGNNLYTVTDIGSAPPSIEFSQSFDYRGTDTRAKIYKIDINKNVASANRTFATGTGTIAYKKSMTAVGEYNYMENNPSKSDILFSIGNGTQSNRSNAFIVRKDGSIHIHPTAKYGGRIDFGDGLIAKANVYIEEDTNNHLSIKSNEGVTFINGNGNVEIYSDARVSARVNGVSDVYLGCPIGTIVMWAGNNKPINYFICDGTEIELYDINRPTSPVQSWEPNFSKAAAQSIQGITIEKDGIQGLIDTISGIYGVRCYYTIEDGGVTKYLEGYIGEGGYTHYRLSTTRYDFPQALSEEEFNSQGFDVDYDMWNFTSHYYIKLPDLRGKFPLGAQANNTIGKYWTDDTHTVSSAWSTDLGKIGGEDTNTMDVSEMPSHIHSISYANSENTRYDGQLQLRSGPQHDSTSTSSTGNSSPHNNVPPYLAINFIIKYA